MRNTRKILVALLLLMALMVSVFAVTVSAAAGETWIVAGSQSLCGSNWSVTDTNNQMTYDSATDSYVKVYTNVKAGNYEFKCAKNKSWNTAYPSSNKQVKVEKDGSTVTITLKGTSVTVLVEAPSCDHNYSISAETVTCTAAGTRTWTCSKCNESYTENLSALGHHYTESGKCEKCDVTTQVVKVYLDNAANWADVYCYVWDVDPYVAWPGEKMAKDADGLYYYVVPTNCPNIIFNNGAGVQTADLKTPIDRNVIYNNSTKAWSAPAQEPDHVHVFADATCILPQKCECGEIQGEALGHSFGADGVCTACSYAPAYIIAGDVMKDESENYKEGSNFLGTIWDASNTNNKLAYNTETGLFEKSYSGVAAGEYHVKVVLGGTWYGNSEGQNHYIAVANANSIVTITFNPKTNAIAHSVELPAHEHSFVDGKCECGESDPNYVVYTVTGSGTLCGADWSYNEIANDMILGEDGLYTKTFENVAAGKHEFKVIKNRAWADQGGAEYPSTNFAFFVAEEGSKVVISLDVASGKVGCLVYAPGSETPIVCSGEIYLVVGDSALCGDVVNTENEGWGWEFENYANLLNLNAEGKYEIVYTNVPAGNHGIKVVKNFSWDNQWGGTGEGGNYIIEVATAGSTVTITFDPATGISHSVEAPHEHNFVEGKCECGEEDPNYVPPVEKEEYIFTSDLVAVPGADKDAIAEGTTYVDGYFTVVGKVTTRWSEGKGVYAIELDKKSNGALQFTVAGNSTIVVSFASTGGSNLSLIGLVDAEGNAITPTEGVEEVTGTSFITVTYTVGAGTYKVVNPSSDRNTRVNSVAVAPAEEAPHVNTLVVGETNKIVVSGNTVNAANLPIEWIAFVADEKAHYEFVGDNGALVYIFDAELNLLCGGTGKADLEAGAYLICAGNGFVGEFNVAVTKTAIEEPVAPEYNWWVSDGSLYVVEGNNIKYNGAGNTYACVGCDVTALAAGNNTFTITITNNGSAIAKVRVDLQATVQVGNHKVVNVSAVGGDVWTDSDWGGSHVHVAPGESVTLVITYDENTERGAVKDLIIFADSGRGDAETYSADITVSDMAFSKVSDEPAHENTLAIGDNKIVVTGNTVNAANAPIEWVEFVVTEKAHYEFTGDTYAFIYTKMDLADYSACVCGFTGKADLEPGTYYICIGGVMTGEFNITVTKSEIEGGEDPVDPPVTPDEVPELKIGENTIVIDGTYTNVLGNAIGWYKLVIEEAGTYALVSDDVTGYFYSKMDINDFSACICGFKGVAELQPGTYYVCAGKDGKTGEFTLTVSNGSDVEVPAANTVVLGENKYVLNAPLYAIGYEFTTFVADKAGYYTFTGADPVTIFIWPDYPNTAVTLIPQTAPYVWNVKADNSGFNESFTVYLEAGEYAIGFRYDFAEVGEYDYTITYSETDPNALTLIQQIIKMITEFFNKIAVWFKGFVGGLMK